MSEALAHPCISSREEWLAARKQLLEQEKAFTKLYDSINAARRRLPMVKVEKAYSFDGADGVKSLADLFDGKIQLITYHFMFAPEWEEGCPGCTGYVDAIADLSALAKKDTNMVLVSRAPYPKLAAYKQLRGWTLPWYSSGDGDFNYDFGVTLDPTRGPASYNYKSTEVEKTTEMPGTSVFFMLDGEIYHTYSCFARGGEMLTHSSALLDITPYGRQEEFEDSPPGWPQRPTYE